jgi:hypothetical protein
VSVSVLSAAVFMRARGVRRFQLGLFGVEVEAQHLV